jgi:hypothetical protein
MVVTSGLALTAIEARDEARDQRREAESLVAFMLGDLKDKLEPIGRLDALDGVGSRVLAYYSMQDASDLSDSSLLQRSSALSLTAQVALLRGDIAAARACTGRQEPAPKRRSAATPKIPSVCSTMPRTSSGSASWRGSAGKCAKPKRQCANIRPWPTAWSRWTPTT